jgi:hypothetical protein
MGRKSKVSALPAPVLEEVDRLLGSGRYTLDQICAHLRALSTQGDIAPEALPSRSALGRHAKNYAEVARQMRQTQEVAAAWRRDLLANPEGDVGQLLIQMLETQTFGAMVQMAEAAGQSDEAPAADELELLSRVVKNAAQADTLNAKRFLTLRAEAKREAAEEFKRRLDELAAQAGPGNGIDLRTLEEAQRMLGFR